MVVQVILDGVFAEQVCGLCGNFDGNAANDYKVCVGGGGMCVYVWGLWSIFEENKYRGGTSEATSSWPLIDFDVV